ncbi:hypothetical protein GBAR_LOCUS15276 [Geodia barretti]|uniref:Uncharacterized protein n=1 Tax=Geodia barretti TaxID=519541 RepID=A0AA35SAR1_GEOBA|nr:hypothetical protein GBAR_LOCUS15276 [Geodia barretti]
MAFGVDQRPCAGVGVSNRTGGSRVTSLRERDTRRSHRP